MYAKFKSYLKQNFSDVVVGICIITLLIMLMFGARNIFGSRTDQDNDVNGTVEQIKESAATVDAEIGNAGREIKTAKSANARATEAITRSEATTRDIQQGVGECEQLIGECKELNNELGELLDEIGKSNQADTSRK